MSGFIFIVLLFSAIAAGITALLGLLRFRFAKYIPGILLLVGAGIMLIQARFALFGSNGEMGDLALIVSAMVISISGVIGLITAALLDLFKKKRET
jgi:hypothetical protein